MKTPFHATIVTGAPEARLAKGQTLARALVCSGETGKKPCGLWMCRDCRKVLQGIHPDVIPVERFMEEKDIGGAIKIDPIRALRADAFIRPNEAERKVYLIDNAQNLNVNAQNALLKLLEEGPPHAAFLLMTDRAGSLLETIRSRCVQVSAGEDPVEEEYDPAALEFAELLRGGKELDKMAFLAKMECAKPDRARQESFLSSLERIFNDAALGGVTGRFETVAAQSLAARMSRAELLDRAEAARKALDMLPFHVAPGHLLGWLGTQL